MRTRSYTSIFGLTLIVLLAASCSTDQAAPVPEGWFSATILGSESISYRGTGLFFSNRDLPALPEEVPSLFYLFSAGTGSSAGEEFILTGYQGERPRVGRYPLGRSQNGVHDWNLNYNVERGDSVALYGVVDGEFEVTASSDESIEGRFSITAVTGVVCSKERGIVRGEDGIPILPCTFQTGTELPTVEINGSFNVLQGLPCVSISAGDTLAAAPHGFRPVSCFTISN